MLLRTRRVRSLNIVTTFRLDRAKPIDADDKQLGRGVRVATQIIASQVTWRRMKNSRILHDHRSLLLRTLRGLSSHGCFGSTKIVHSGYWHRYDLMPGKCDEKGICRAGEGSRLLQHAPRARPHSRPRWLAFLFPSRLRVQGLRSVEGHGGVRRWEMVALGAPVPPVSQWEGPKNPTLFPMFIRLTCNWLQTGGANEVP
jgi:hypothetical protein